MPAPRRVPTPVVTIIAMGRGRRASSSNAYRFVPRARARTRGRVPHPLAIITAMAPSVDHDPGHFVRVARLLVQLSCLREQLQLNVEIHSPV